MRMQAPIFERMQSQPRIMTVAQHETLFLLICVVLPLAVAATEADVITQPQAELAPLASDMQG